MTCGRAGRVPSDTSRNGRGTMVQRLSGGCACGAVRYETDADPIVMLNCHCSDCRKASGSGYAAIVIVRKDSLQRHGEARFHKVRGGSGRTVERGFCTNCGSPIFVKVERFPDLLGVQAGSLDDPAQHKPSMDLYTDSAPPWDSMRSETTKFPRGRSA